MTRDALELRARALHAHRHALRDHHMDWHRRFPDGTAVVVEQGGLTLLYRGHAMLSVDHTGAVQSPLSDEGLLDIVATLEGVLQAA